jgi:hypothetical protein
MPNVDRIVTYGIRPFADDESDQVFTLDPAGGTWVAAIDGPGARQGHSMGFDHDSGLLLAFGGETDDAPSSGVFGFNGATWTDVGPQAFPGVRIDGYALVDPDRERIVMMGGTIGGAGQTDVWEWVAGRWVRSMAVGGPDDIGGRAVYDPTRRRVVYVENEPLHRTHEYVSRGSPCDDDDDCATGICEDEVCCNQPCPAGTVCNSSASAGMCAPPDE